MSIEELEQSAEVLDAPKSEEPIATATDGEPSLNFMKDWFELSATDRLNVENQGRIQYIFEFVSKTVGKADPMSVYQYLRDLSYRLGAPRMGMSKLQHVYQWIKIQNQRKVLDLKEEELKG